RLRRVAGGRHAGRRVLSYTEWRSEQAHRDAFGMSVAQRDSAWRQLRGVPGIRPLRVHMGVPVLPLPRLNTSGRRQAAELPHPGAAESMARNAWPAIAVARSFMYSTTQPM